MIVLFANRNRNYRGNIPNCHRTRLLPEWLLPSGHNRIHNDPKVPFSLSPTHSLYNLNTYLSPW